MWGCVAVFDGIKVAASEGANVTVVTASNSTDMVRIVFCAILRAECSHYSTMVIVYHHIEDETCVNNRL